MSAYSIHFCTEIRKKNNKPIVQKELYSEAMSNKTRHCRGWGCGRGGGGGGGEGVDEMYFLQVPVCPAKTDQPAHPQNLIRIFAGHSVESQGSKKSSITKTRLFKYIENFTSKN